MKYINLFATTAMSVALAAGAASAQESLQSDSYSAGVSLLSPDVTGFLYGGTTEVTGLGSAAVVVSADKALFSMSGFASSTASVMGEALSDSGSLTMLDFDRTVTASASGIGMGRVVAQGEANASVGSVGTSSGETMANRMFDDGAGYSQSSTSDAVSTSTASLIGTGTTSVIAGLIGTSDEFIGSTGTTVSSTQSGVAYSGLAVSGATGMTIGEALDPTSSPYATQLAGLTAGNGIIGFTNQFTLGGGTIDLGVTNIGGGTISLGASTGGFFGGGASTFGESGSGSVSSGS